MAPSSEDFPSNISESDLEISESPPALPNNHDPSNAPKKPARKPNPVSAALRKAQNRAAQRAFRERKEHHLRDLEISVKQMREERDRLRTENEQFKVELNTLRNENWYMKGMLLTMHLACYRHGIAVPQHAPHVDGEEALRFLGQTSPESIAAYIQANAKNKPPATVNDATHIEPISHKKTREQFVSKGSLVVTKDDIQTFAYGARDFASSREEPDTVVSKVLPTVPPLDHDEDATRSNVVAIQTLRLRLRLQTVCTQMDSRPFTLQPTPLQLTIPHDPRIDLIPTRAMRDRMILFRDLFDLEDCFRRIIAEVTFLGGDPTSSSSWQLSPEFFDQYWYLTADYSAQGVTDRWLNTSFLQPLPGHFLEINDINFLNPCSQREQQQQQPRQSTEASPMQPVKEPYVHPNSVVFKQAWVDRGSWLRRMNRIMVYFTIRVMINSVFDTDLT